MVHTQADTIEELSKFRGSKYVQSDVNVTYKQVYEYLKQGRKVLFSGTPCQINGLSNYLKKNYDNLLLVDCICHGVPSPLVWKNYVENKEKEFNSNIKQISFRHKNYGWKRYAVSFLFKNDTAYLEFFDKDNYMKGFLSDLYLRPSCYSCEAKGEKRAADITLGDFWGIENIVPHLDDDKGTSLVIVNTSKGKRVFEDVKKNMIYEKVNFGKAAKCNSAYMTSVKKNENRGRFFNELEQSSLNELIIKYGYKKQSFVKKVLVKVKRIIKKVLKCLRIM